MTTSYWVRPAAPAVAPKTNNFTPLVSFFNPKQQENKLGAHAVAENESEPVAFGSRDPASPSALSNTNQLPSENEWNNPTERNVYHGWKLGLNFYL